MTNQEAIETLKNIKAGFETDEWLQDDIEALDKGIKALELQSSFINELKDLKEKTESYLETINGELDWFGENKE